jgi:hypothetical protein
MEIVSFGVYGMLNEDERRSSADNIRHPGAAMLCHLSKVKDILDAAQPGMTSNQFRTWALDELGLDEATLQDFLAFDGSMATMTARMLGHFMKTHTRRKTA